MTRKMIVIVTILMVGTVFENNVYADAISSTSSSSSGGGGGGSAAISTERNSTETRQEIDFDGFEAYIYAENREAWLHTGVDDNGIPWSHFHEKEAYGNAYFTLEQGFMGKNFKPVRPQMEIRRWDDEGNFEVQATWRFIFTEDVSDWNDALSSGTNWNLFDLNFDIGVSLQHETEWIWDNYLEEGHSIVTPNIQGNAYVSFQNAEITYANLYIDDYMMYSDEQQIDGMELEARWSLQYAGDEQGLVVLNSAVQMVPEPASFVLFAGGLLAMLRRCRK